MGYKATNKKEFIKQMTIWLCRQESIQQFCLYLQWAIPGYTAEISKNDGEVGEDEEEDKEEDDPLSVIMGQLISYSTSLRSSIWNHWLATLH